MAGRKRKQHHSVLLAHQNRNSIFPTFNAHTALWRAIELLKDAEHLKSVYDSRGSEADRGRLKGFVVTDYYAVGYVTCLEWHARSRLTDVLTWNPELIQSSSIKSISDDAISQTLDANVSISDLIGASTKINNLAGYINIFGQVWAALGITAPLKRLLAVSEKLAGRDGALNLLFDRRHSLVHETRNTKVGHYLLRDTWSFDEAISHGRMIVSVIQEIEKHISGAAPDNFPNRLDERGLPEDRMIVLERRIRELEGRIAAAISGGVEALRSARSSFERDLNAQIDFIDLALADVPKRYYNPKPTIIEMMYRQKLEFLSTLAEELDV